MSKNIDSIFYSICDENQKWLLLFDIDGTLVDTKGKGMAALKLAAIDIFKSEGPELDLAGSTDLGILENLCEHFGAKHNDELTNHFFDTYHRHLKVTLDSNPSKNEILSGAKEILEYLNIYTDTQLALLTGNTSLGAEIKLKHYELNNFFKFGAYGSDHADRNQLGYIALERALDITGHSYDPNQTIIIGDTPKDIACAHAIGARCIAVSTGRFTSEELRDAGSDWVIDSLTDLPFQKI